FEVTEKGEIRWHMAERLNTLWDWHRDWKERLTTVNRKHPKWQWRQWAAQVLKEQLEADIVICEDPLRFKYSAPEGRITYRDLFNGFRNDWLVKIRLTGKTLRDLLSAQVTNVPDGQASAVVIEGFSFVKPQDKHDVTVPGMDDLKNDKIYVVALSYTLVNGERLGMVLKDYEIAGEGYMVPLLAEYLRNNRVLDIDTQLDGIKPTVF
ncbi:MAG TPA: 5'-nucleotidase C-terminal domain-containing protein, partial [Sedimentisphaerales bacterium]|nr:5'-nucleotidase C-terminal domain-containing protein [Sedimentisphaerales bacterium]